MRKRRWSDAAGMPGSASSRVARPASLERVIAGHETEDSAPAITLSRDAGRATRDEADPGMPAASLHRRFLIVTAFAAYALVFMSLVVFEVPGLGLGHFFYIPVALLALAGGTWLGLVGGGFATALYALAILVTPRVPSGEVLTYATAIRFVTYTCCGMLVGWFANQHRHHLRELRELAERDFLTGILNT